MMKPLGVVAKKVRLSQLEWLLIITGGVILLLTVRPAIDSDGVVRFQSLVELASGQVPQGKFSLLQPVLSLPLWAIESLLGGQSGQWVAYFNLMVFFVVGSLTYRPLREDYGAAEARIFLLMVMGASMFPHHLQHYFGEVLTAMLLWLGFLYSQRSPRVSAVVIALAVTNTPALLPALGIAAAVQWLWRRNIVLLQATVLAGMLFFAEQVVKYGFPPQSPYLSAGEMGFKTLMPYSGQPGFSYPLMFGLLSIVLSFGKGLVFFLPGVFLPLSRSVRCALSRFQPWRGALVFGCVAVVTYAKWWAWYGGNFWGPRFFLFLSLPASLFLALAVVRPLLNTCGGRFITSLLVVLSMYVAMNGFLYGQANLDLCWANNYQLEFLCWYVPEFSALWRPFVVGFHIHAIPFGRIVFVVWQGAFLLVVLWRILRPARREADKDVSAMDDSPC
jgi:hypothetical protein